MVVLRVVVQSLSAIEVESAHAKLVQPFQLSAHCEPQLVTNDRAVHTEGGVVVPQELRARGEVGIRLEHLGWNGRQQIGAQLLRYYDTSFGVNGPIVRDKIGRASCRE